MASEQLSHSAVRNGKLNGMTNFLCQHKRLAFGKECRRALAMVLCAFCSSPVMRWHTGMVFDWYSMTEIKSTKNILQPF